jgi:ribosomal protein S18 acetylase RimI-like enzyme
MEADAMSEWRFVVRLDAEPVARARFMILPSLPDCPQSRSATLYQLEVEPERQRQGIGRWLLERSINHLIAQGVDRLLVDAPHEDVLLHARLYRLQFREQALRGYTYAKKHV